MVHVQPVKSVWSTLHKVLLQTVGNKQRETEQSVLCLEEDDEEEEEGKWSSQKDTRSIFTELPEAIPSSLNTHLTLLPTSLCSSAILIQSQSYTF